MAAPTVAQGKSWAEGQKPGESNTRAFPNLTILYRFNGVRDDASPGFAGEATVLHCTNWGPAATIRTLLRLDDGTIIGVATQSIATGVSLTGSTKGTAMYFDDYFLVQSPQLLQQGSLQVYATSPHVQCTAQVLDAAGIPAAFVVDLPSQRANPPNGVTQ